ncbi:MoxR family ATPase [Puniceicoccales bacterium CK1056]|uniref:MoxR family ATPase n=1 Tax=Oceanipulchritudo coccoides TaxID=2706888 RepID=A0A6B2M373_9BACT|nr:MoxR family ATPase [Oceanipulchritudo coccoides]NDV62527.1 MoxR family ATPase [Oceanipulchritudo coccoides]
MTPKPADRDGIHSSLQALKDRMGTIIRGKSDVLDSVLICLLGGGHILLEDLPGMGKTTLAYALARALSGSFQRIQFTSDLLPADVLGVSVFNEKVRDFEFKPGPVFANIILADEINRTTPKTQSALLEVMDRGRISIDGETHLVGQPFMVFATQNPVDFEGTFPLPDSQMDRFFMRLEMGYPSYQDEMKVLEAGFRHYDQIADDPIVDLESVLLWQSMVAGIFVEESVLDYILKLVVATRSESTFQAGLSPRGALSLKAAAQARALYLGREFVLPEDVEKMLLPVCAHRLKSTPHGSNPMEERRRVEGVLRHILETVPLPR